MFADFPHYQNCIIIIKVVAVSEVFPFPAFVNVVKPCVVAMVKLREIIRMIARTEKGEFREPPLTEDEKDILGIRLDWAYWIAAEMGAKRPGEVGFEPYGSRVSEEEIEDILINRWQKEGREKYWPLDEQIRERLRSAGLNVKPRDEVKKETGGGETKPPSESGGFRGRRF